MNPRVGSYGETATVTRSPSTTRMRWRRTLPASFARTSWPLSSLTRKLPPFAIKMTSPSRWTSSSLLTGPLEALWLALHGAQEKRFGAKVIYPLGLPGRRTAALRVSSTSCATTMLRCGMRAEGLTVVLLGACYHPAPPGDVPCAANGDCPVGLQCDHSVSPPTCVDHTTEPPQDAIVPDA